MPRYRSVVWMEAWPRSNWICSSSPPAARHSFAAVLRQSWGAIPSTPAAAAYGRSICHTTFSDSTSPCTWSPRFTGRKTYPSTTLAGPVQASMATFTQTGIGTVRTRPCFPQRSTMHQGPSRCCTWFIVSAATTLQAWVHHQGSVGANESFPLAPVTRAARNAAKNPLARASTGLRMPIGRQLRIVG